MEFSLRNWQKDAISCYREALQREARSVLWEATPGAGKTRAALIVASHQIRALKRPRLLVVVPTAHLKLQWGKAAAQFHINLDVNYAGEVGAGELSLSRDFHGAVVTYSQLANNPQHFAKFSRSGAALLDEVHHAGDGLTWGNSLGIALGETKFILCLSGTPFRSDNNPIPFVEYDRTGESVPNYSYPYSRAIEDGVCRPTAFFAYGGELAWSVGNSTVEADFTAALDRHNSSRRLRAALDPESGWIDPVIKDAHAMLEKIRLTHREAGGLLVAADRDHARTLARVIKQITKESATVVLSDDATASKKIREFSANSTKWLVACNMVSEGVDIPRLRVGVYATTIRTRMYFRQFLGRIVRQTQEPAGVQVAYCYLPADPVLQGHAREIESEQRHRIQASSADEFFERLADLERERTKEKPTFEAVRAVNSGVDAVIVNGSQLTLFGNLLSADTETMRVPDVQEVIQREIHSRFDQSLTRSELKLALARKIKELVASYHKASGSPYALVHTTLNRKQNVRSQVQCTVKQLEERIQLLETWLTEGRGLNRSVAP